ncbi:MAG: hypothetical protein PQJ60_03545 [Spirochaetales bacterium]|nr:hypothetical protein [Spirochaetales bacterium]
MKKNSLIGIILMFTLASVGLFGFDDGELNKITFINKTGADIWYLFLSPGDSMEWGFDILGSERTLSDNSVLSFYIHYPDYENYFDIMAVDEWGNSFTLFDELVSDDEESNIIIDESDMDGDSGDSDFIEVSFLNDTDFQMYYIFVSPDDSIMWGVDMMDDEQILMPGDELSLLAMYGEGITGYDVMAVDSDLDEYVFSFEVDSDYVDPDDSLSYKIEYSDLVTE